MVTKSKIQIETDASSFGEFYDKFNQFKKSLDELPDGWKSVSFASEESKSKFEELTAVLGEATADINLFLEKSNRLDQVTDRTSRHWKELARNTQTVAKNIGEATMSLLKWAGITSVIGGITTGGALFGLDRLAGSIGQQRTEALGLGTTYGGLSAFRTQFGRIGDAEGFLRRVSEAQSDPNKWGTFGALGMGDRDFKDRDAADTAVTVLERIKKLVDETPESGLQNLIETHQLEGFADLGLLKSLKGLKGSEFTELKRGFPGLREDLSLTPEQQLRYQNFSTSLEKSARIIGNTFVERMSALLPGLERLAKSFGDLVAVLLKDGGPVSVFMEHLGQGLKNLAEHFGVGASKADIEEEVRKFEADLKSVGQSLLTLGKFVVKLGNIFGELFGITPAEASTGPYGEGNLPAGGAGGAGGADGGGAEDSGRGAEGRGGASKMIRDRTSRFDANKQGQSSTANQTKAREFEETNDFFRSIMEAEGTTKYGDPYNTSLGYAKPPKPLVEMTMAETLAWGEELKRRFHLNASPKGAFQIVNKSQRRAMEALGIGMDELFTEENQKRMASWLARHGGLGHWAGFLRHPDLRRKAQEALNKGMDKYVTNSAPAKEESNINNSSSLKPYTPSKETVLGKSTKITIMGTPGATPSTASALSAFR